jgi:hypothetical protein
VKLTPEITFIEFFVDLKEMSRFLTSRRDMAGYSSSCLRNHRFTSLSAIIFFKVPLK